VIELPEPVRRFLRPNALWLALAAAAGLTWIGIHAIAVAPPPPHELPRNLADKQLHLWLPVALAALGLCLLPHPRQIGALSYPALLLGLLLLAVTAAPSMPRSIVPVMNGARHWIRIGGLSMQPSELAKIAFILALARYLRHRESYRTLPGLLVPFGIMFIPVALILREPDLGTAILFPPVLFAVLLAAGARLRHILSLLGLAGLVVAVVVAGIFVLPEKWQVLDYHQRVRIVALVSHHRGEDRYASGPGYQQEKAMTLVGSGGVHGYGAQRAATMIRFNYLPEAASDMVFAVVVNQWGLVGGMALLGLDALLILSLLWAAGRHKDPYARLVLVGFAALLLTQVAINVGMSLGLMPIIGINLPFVSSGGTSLLAMFTLLGLALNLAAQRPAIIARPAFEFDRGGMVTP
jgi:cell division protein FtsW (lipid II flippase)